MLECVANVSEGRDHHVIGALASACGPCLLDVHSDVDHHRSVFTMAGAYSEVVAAVVALARAAVDHVDMSRHEGVHPRMGALDVVPLVPLGTTPMSTAVSAAHELLRRLGELGVPGFAYDHADPQGRSLPAVRREAFVHWAPDFGPVIPHPTAGATAVSARPLLVAINCNLDTDDLSLARLVASAVRESSGGLPAVRALGLPLPSQGRAQVAMNLVDLATTGVEQACTEVRRLVSEGGADVGCVELVGLMPAAEFDGCSTAFIEWSRLDRGKTIEARLEQSGRSPSAG